METRKFVFEEWRKRGRSLPPDVVAGRRPGPKRRPRDPDEWAVLLDIAMARRRQYIACGKLEVLPDGNYRFHIGQDKVMAHLAAQEDE